MIPQKLILSNQQSPGDIVMLTAAVRELHECYPGQYLTDVRTPCPDLWAHNPHVTPIADDDPAARTIECHYPLIHQSNQSPHHFIHGFIQYLNAELGLNIRPKWFKGDIHLSVAERRAPSVVAQRTGADVPYWLVVAGGKQDFTAKWWAAERFQRVVDHFRGKILFVQVGEAGHPHPPLRHVLDLRGQTTLRQLVLAMHPAQGVLCPVTLAMHLAAAVEPRAQAPRARACVVVAGGREPAPWEQYANHQFLHTNGALACCPSGGCWRSRVLPLGDGDGNDRNLCVDVVQGLPRCMEMITPEDVIRRIELPFQGGVCRYLSADQARLLNSVLTP